MATALMILGTALVLVSLTDIVVSTLSTTGGGPVSMRIAGGLWHVALACHRRWRFDGLLKRCAPAMILLMIGVWLGGLCAGWLAIFSAFPDAVVDASTQAPAALADRLYFVGFSLVTLGTGDFVGGHAGWRIASTVCAFSGLFVVTLSLTYVMSVLSAATEKRQLSILLHALGEDTPGILRRAWNGTDLGALDDVLAQLAPQVALHAERHLAYPIVHFFHAVERRTALAVSVAALDDALTVVIDGLRSKEASPNPLVVRAMREAISVLLDRAGRGPSGSEAPAPDLAAMRGAGPPLKDDDRLRSVFEAASERRRHLAAYVGGQGHQWPWPQPSRARSGEVS
ncbi:MAG: ion channel [Sandaracinaceae bacterium]